jgi:hypothetical protein
MKPPLLPVSKSQWKLIRHVPLLWPDLLICSDWQIIPLQSPLTWNNICGGIWFGLYKCVIWRKIMTSTCKFCTYTTFTVWGCICFILRRSTLLKQPAGRVGTATYISDTACPPTHNEECLPTGNEKRETSEVSQLHLCSSSSAWNRKLNPILSFRNWIRIPV